MLKKVILFLIIFWMVQGFPSFQNMIPNGSKVPNPCPGGWQKWMGVGHLSESGGGTLNSFGKDFDANGFKWTAICQLDSDGDGKSNGMELGDPHCEWDVGKTVSGNATGHPGICEPMSSSKCTNKNNGIDCSRKNDWVTG